MIKFIHTGDLHLGLQFKKVSFPEEISNRRRIELWGTFERIVDKAIEDKTDFLFIAGDLFEEEYFTLGDMKRVRDTLGKAKNVNILITAGNHDTLNNNSLYYMVDWPDNITIFHSKGLEKRNFEDIGVCIYGYSWDVAENNQNIFQDFEKLNEEKINILIIHGDLFSKDSYYLPLDKKHIESLGFNYIALGHIHKPEIFSNKMAYCGSPEPLHFGETGKHGIIKGKVSKEDTQIKFIPFSRRMFIEKTIEINEYMSYLDIVNHIKECDKEENLKDNLYRVALDGIVDRDIALDIDDLVKSLENDFYYIEIIDNTTIDYDLEKLEEENIDNIIGYFIREMKTKDIEDRTIKDALYIGLEVLMKGRVRL